MSNTHMSLMSQHLSPAVTVSCLEMFKSDHIKNIFTWKKKIIFEKDKPSGAYEVTIELRILQNSFN